MDRAPLTVVVVAVIAVTAQTRAAAQGGGATCPTWATQTMVGPKDSVVSTSVLTFSADGKSGTLKVANHDPIALRVVARGGDSTVTEAGPYPSVLRPGQTVTLLRTVSHVKGNTMTGTFEARYESGDVLHGKTKGTCTK